MTRKRSFIFVLDYDMTIGNLSEKLLYALFKADRLNLKIRFIRKRVFFQSILKKRFNYSQREGVYKIRGTLLAKPNVFFDLIFGYYFGVKHFLNLVGQFFLYKLKFRQKFETQVSGKGYQDIFNINQSRVFDANNLNAVNWKFYLQKKQELYFDSKDNEKCLKDFNALGLQTEKPYVCLHIRTGFYHRDNNGKSQYRNSSIERYLDALKYIKSQGFDIVRLGDPVDLGYNRYYIDYPNTRYKSELMDLFLIKNCSFYFGTNSGIVEAAFLFGVPVLAVNVTDYVFVKPYKKSDIFIYKYVFSKEKNRFLTYEEIFNSGFLINSDCNANNIDRFHEKYILYEDTAEDILEATKEMCENLSHITDETNMQIQFKDKINGAVWRWMQDGAYYKNNLEKAYRGLTKTYFNGRIGRHFAEKYLYGTIDLPHDKERYYETE